MEPLAEEVDGITVGHCDVTEPETIDAVFESVKNAWGSLDFVVHAIAFSDKDQLDGRYVDTTRRQFHEDDADLVLLVHRDRAARRKADE